MWRIYLAELRDSWPAWLGVSLAFIVTNLSFATSALVLASGWSAIESGTLVLNDSAEFTATPITNFVFSGVVALVVIAGSARMVVDSRRAALARLGLAGATPGQVVLSVLVQLALVSLASAVVADAIALITLDPYLAFLTEGVESGLTIGQPPAVYAIGPMLAANLGVVAVALLGGLAQAKRAAAVTPVEAMRQASGGGEFGMRRGRWVGVGLCSLLLVGLFGAIWPIAADRNSETVSTLLQLSVVSLLVFVTLVALLAPVLIGPLTQAWTALLPVRDPAYVLTRLNLAARGRQFARAAIPVIFTVGLLFGLLSIFPTIYATSLINEFPGGAVTLDKANLGAVLSLIGPALAIALAGGIGSVFMMSKRRDAELALLGITGATPAQRQRMAVLEALILTVTATMLGLAAYAVMAGHFALSLSLAGYRPALSVPGSAWLVSVVGTALVLVAATYLPTLRALGRPEPRVVAALVAE